MRVIAVINQKGGVGKTTTALNLSHALSTVGYEVVVIDMDPQSHLGTSLGVSARQAPGLDRVLLEGDDIAEHTMEVRDGLRLLPTGPRLGELETISTGGKDRGWLLKDALERFVEDDQPDFVFFDCPPSSGMIGMNAIFAAGELLIPVSGDYLALHGVSRMIGIIEHIDNALGRVTERWIALTRFNERRRLAQEVRDKLLEYFPGRILATPVRELVALAESPSFGQTIFEYQGKSGAAEDYMNLARDLVNRRTM